MDPVIVFLFFWAVVASGLFVRACGTWGESEILRWRAERDADLYRDEASKWSKATHDAAKEAADWFYRTRVAHARRKRLQKVVDRLFRRLGPTELDRIELVQDNADYADLTALVLRHRDEARAERDEARVEIKTLSEGWGAASEALTSYRSELESLAGELVLAQTCADRMTEAHELAATQRDAALKKRDEAVVELNKIRLAVMSWGDLQNVEELVKRDEKRRAPRAAEKRATKKRARTIKKGKRS